MIEKIEVIAFDGDDTLWSNEPFFQQTEARFCELLAEFLPAERISAVLFETEMRNLALYGYGIKGFVLCMIETVCKLEQRADLALVSRVIDLGHELLGQPVLVLPGVEEVLSELSGRYRLVLATKGDLLDQERKLRNSGLEKYFHHIQVMSEKGTEDYRKLLFQMDCSAEHFLMVGNSVKSDILPVLALEGRAVHIPFHTTWAHEIHVEQSADREFLELVAITDLLRILPIE